jgi:hypothetical protein
MVERLAPALAAAMNTAKIVAQLLSGQRIRPSDCGRSDALRPAVLLAVLRRE